MTKPERKEAPRARSIKTKRDFEAAATVVKSLKAKAAQDSAAELRLQHLLGELDKFEEPADEDDLYDSSDDGYSSSGRRWSDSLSERD